MTENQKRKIIRVELLETFAEINDALKADKDVEAVLNNLAKFDENGNPVDSGINVNDLSAVTTTGDYNDLLNKPTIPSVGDAEIEIQKNGTKINSFTTNQSGSKVTINISVPTGTAADKNVPSSGNASNIQVVLGNDTRLSDSRPASDVYSWAKAESKPSYSYSEISNTPTIPTTLPASDVYSWAKQPSKPSYTKSEIGLENVTNDSQVKRTEMGTPSGVATLDENGKVPSSLLPSYVDDVLEYNTKSVFPTTGETGKIYVDKSNNTTWRWSGSTYSQIKGDLVIGTTSGNAADGKIANDHYSNTNNPHSVTKSQVGLGSVVNTGDSATPVSGGTTKFTTGGAYTELNKKVDKVDGKGLSTNDYTTDEKNKLSGIESGAQKHKAPTAAEVKSALGTSSGTSKYLREDGTWVTPQNDNTTYQFSQSGNTLQMGTNGGSKSNIYTPSIPVSSVAGKTGAVTLDKSDVGLGNVGNFKAVSTAASQGLTDTEKSNARANIGAGTSSFSGSYNDLSNKPSIPAAANNGTLTIQKNGTNVQTFTANQSTNATANITVPTKVSELTNDSGFTSNTGTVTSVMGGTGLNGGTISTSGTLSVKYGTVAGTACEGNDSRLSNSRPASDVYSWAKQSTKPSYNLDEVSDGSTRKLADKIGKTTNTTYANLKSLRDNSQLVPGQWYRITDYTCTTTQENTQSAGHVFDVIVRADSVNVLNEDAYAALHSGDTYFASSKLEAWQLQYCIDNDTTRFAWADSTNGKGVVYWMKDEWNNECPYDFKNVRYVKKMGFVAYKYSPSFLTTYERYEANDTTVSGTLYYGFKRVSYVSLPMNEYVWTTTTVLTTSMSLYNISGENVSSVTGTITKVDTLSFNTYTFDNNDSDASISGSSQMVTENSIASYVKGNKQTLNVIYFRSTDSELYAYGNSFKINCYDISFSGSCTRNTFGANNYNNTFGKGCDNNTFGNLCYNNTFGNECNNNTFGNLCYNNTFGNECNNNTFGNTCVYNIFGNGCVYNIFGNGCKHITFSKDYCYNNIVENGNKYITLTSTQTTSSSNALQNIKICQGVNNTETTKTISHNTVNDTFQTEYKPANSQVITV